MGAGRRAIWWLLIAMLASCATRQAYEGPARPTGQVAVVEGDPKFRLAPVSVFLRSVDGQPLRDTQSSASLLPGEHELTVDCVVAESGDRQRMRLQVVLQAGVRYHLEPQLVLANQSCESVRLVPW